MRAAIYARFSAGPNQTEASIEGQEQACLAYIKEKKYSFTKTYADLHITGKTDQRPRFQDMISDAEDGCFSVLVVYSMDRFSRDQYDAPYYKKLLKDAGVRIESATERIPDTPEGVILEKMLEGMAAYYSMELSRKITRGMKTKAEKGMSTGGPTPFGYILKDGSYQIDEARAGAVRQVYEMFLGGESLASCARFLTGLGFKKAPGSVRRILTNKKYLGYYIYDDIEIKGGMPKIIDDEVFYMVQDKLAKNVTPGPPARFPLSRKLVCGSCGTQMTGITGTSKTGVSYRYYNCRGCRRKNIPAAKIEKAVADHVRGVLTSPQELESLIDKLFALQSDENGSDAEYEALKRRLGQTRTKIQKAVGYILEHDDSRAMGKTLSRLEAEEARLKHQIAARRPAPSLTRSQIREGVTRLIRESMTDDEILETLVRRVVVYDDRLLTELNLMNQEGLKTSELLGFAQNGECSTILFIGRTPVITKKWPPE